MGQQLLQRQCGRPSVTTCEASDRVVCMLWSDSSKGSVAGPHCLGAALCWQTGGILSRMQSLQRHCMLIGHTGSGESLPQAAIPCESGRPCCDAALAFTCVRNSRLCCTGTACTA